jgi:hypothetical protein
LLYLDATCDYNSESTGNDLWFLISGKEEIIKKITIFA